MKPARAIPPALFAAPHAAWAQAAPEVGSGLLQMLLGLGFIIALIFASLWLLRRLAAPRGSAANALRIVAGQAVGARERVVIVEVGDTVLVLGVAPGQVTTLHSMPKSALPQTPPAGAVAAHPFASRLRQMMEKRNAPPA
jgi:flagellar protein FliO/FliZ